MPEQPSGEDEFPDSAEFLVDPVEISTNENFAGGGSGFQIREEGVPHFFQCIWMHINADKIALDLKTRDGGCNNVSWKNFSLFQKDEGGRDENGDPRTANIKRG